MSKRPFKTSKIQRAIVLGTAPLALLCHPAAAQESVDAQPNDGTVQDLLNLPIEELLTLESTSVAKKRQRVEDSAAAVTVITQDDIRRSAASNIPDLLRMVPGVEVGQVVSGGTAVTIRGFNSRLANSLLVMIDGRSIYVSSLSGVFWDQLMIPLGDIERIEVVRGPGAALWGSNANNGVINIITKHSSDSLGVIADVRTGTRRQEGTLSFGNRISDTLSVRVHTDVRYDEGLLDAQGKNDSTYNRAKAFGLRMDWEPNARDVVTLQSEYNDGNYDAPFLQIRSDPFNPGYDLTRVGNGFEGYNFLGRWARRATDRLDWTLQAHYDVIKRTEFGNTKLNWQQLDVDFGVHWKASAVHEFNFGIGARSIHDTINNQQIFALFPTSAHDMWLSGYVQDEISLVPDKLRLILGTKLEKNNFSGFEFQPNARLFFRPNPKLAFWASASRAVRTPSRFERSAQLAFSVDLPGSALNPSPLPIYSQLYGLPNRQSEILYAYETGFRADLGRNWSLDVATYYNDYRKLTVPTLQSLAPRFIAPLPFPVGLVADINLEGRGLARTRGIEASLKGELMPWWKAEVTYSHFNYSLATDPATGQPFSLLFPLEGSPRDQIRLHNSMDISDALSLDTDFRHVSSLIGGTIPAYNSADFRILYRPQQRLEVSLIGENLLQARRVEFTQPQYPAPFGFVSRSVSAQLRYRF